MAFMLLSQTVRRLLLVCCSLKELIQIVSISPLSRLIYWPTCPDIGVRPQYDPEANETGHGKVKTITRDAQGQFISGGLTGIVELLDDGTVLKSPFPDAEMENHILDIAKEASIYHRLGPHERLVRVIGHSRDGLILEYMENSDLKTHIQAGNFSGSSLDGSKPASGEGTRFYLPRHWKEPPTVATDLFALGPYEEIPSDQVEELLKRKEFPDVSAIPCGEIIKQCWLSQIDSAEHVGDSIQEINRSKLNAECILHLDGLDIAQDI
ncbi:protein kinase [Aspergillus karnatakaensis]|uniref:protein kinase n=1 Tax=Aspergillus karnatakaensis TaxID=1810916 RepID=UPI003CCD683E